MSATTKEIEERPKKNFSKKNIYILIKSFHKRLSPLLREGYAYALCKQVESIIEEFKGNQQALELLQFYLGKIFSKNKELTHTSMSKNPNPMDKEEADVMQKSIQSMDTYITILEGLYNRPHHDPDRIILDTSGHSSLYNFIEELICVISHERIDLFNCENSSPLTTEDTLKILNSLSEKKHLKVFIFEGNNLDDCVFSIIELIKNNPELKQLKFANYPKESTPLFQAIMNQNQSVNLRIRVTEEVEFLNLEPLKNLCQNANNITTLEMSGSIFAKGIFKEFCFALHHSNILELGLESSKLSTNDIPGLVLALRHNNTITELALGGNQFSSEGVELLAEAFTIQDKEIGNQSLISLDMRDIKIAKQCAIKAKSLKKLLTALESHPALTTLGFQHNQIDDEGAKAFAELLESKNTKLARLDIAGNPIGLEGAKHISNALLVNRSLTTLIMYSCKIEEDSALLFEKVFKINKTLTTLDFCDVCISSKLATRLTSGLKINKTLTSLSMQKPLEREKDLQLFEETLRTNKTLTFLKLDLEYLDSTITFLNPQKEACRKRLKENQKLQTIHNWNVSRTAILISFIRANANSPIRHSVLPLIPTIMANIKSP